MFFLQRLKLISALALLPHYAIGAEITAASIENGILTITGSGFGPSSPMSFWDNSSDAFNDSGKSPGDLVPAGPTEKWRTTDTPWGNPMEYQKNSLSKLSRPDPYYFAIGKVSILGTPNLSQQNIDQEMYVSWWYRPSMSPFAAGGSNKFIRVWDDPNGLGTRISWTQMHMTCGSGSTVSWGDWQGDVAEWNHMEFYVNTQTNTVKAWVNGKQNHNASNCAKVSAGNGIPIFIELIGFDHGNSDYSAMETSLDDIYIGNSLRHIEISDSSEWSREMKKEIAPISDWSDNSIETLLFSSTKVKYSGSIYVYFIDETGTPSSTTGVQVECFDCPKLQ